MSAREEEEDARRAAADDAAESDAAEAATGAELIAIARIVKTRGLRGEVAAELLTDFPERFDSLEGVVGVSPRGERQPLTLAEHWLQGNRIILRFDGYDAPETASALVGYEVAVPEAEAVELEEDEFYDWELEGCRVETIEGATVGQVDEVLHTGGDAPILVIHSVDADGRRREHLVPLAESICVEIDTERRLIRVDAPEGLLEL